MLDTFKSEFEKVIEKCKEEVASMRTARATPALVENIQVYVYDTKTPLQQLATITIPDPRSIIIAPWDKSTTKLIEESITKADIGINPVNEGDIIRLAIPQLTEDRRKDLVKNLNKKCEEFRVSIRQVRDKVREKIMDMEKNNELTQDDKYKYLADLDNLTTDYNKQIKDIGDKKEEEIMTI